MPTIAWHEKEDRERLVMTIVVQPNVLKKV